MTKETGDAIREYGLDGVKVDEDSRRYYPFGNLASKVIGFTGSDNQGIIGLEVRYEEETLSESRPEKVVQPITTEVHFVWSPSFIQMR